MGGKEARWRPMAQTDSASIHEPAWILKLGTGRKRDGNLTSAP